MLLLYNIPIHCVWILSRKLICFIMVAIFVTLGGNNTRDTDNNSLDLASQSALSEIFSPVIVQQNNLCIRDIKQSYRWWVAVKENYPFSISSQPYFSHRQFCHKLRRGKQQITHSILEIQHEDNSFRFLKLFSFSLILSVRLFSIRNLCDFLYRGVENGCNL